LSYFRLYLICLDPFDDFKARNLEVSICLNIPYGKDINIDETKKTQLANDRKRMSRYMIKNSGSPFIYFQTDFINWLLNLPSLRYDMLRLYKIHVNKYAEDIEEEHIEGEMHEIKNGMYSDYLELIKYSLNAQLNHGDEEGKVLSLISGVNLKIHIGSTR